MWAHVCTHTRMRACALAPADWGARAAKAGMPDQGSLPEEPDQGLRFHARVLQIYNCHHFGAWVLQMNNCHHFGAWVFQMYNCHHVGAWPGY